MPDDTAHPGGPAPAENGDAARITPSHPDADTDRAVLTGAARTFFAIFFRGNATNPTPQMLRALHAVVSETKKRFTARAIPLRTGECGHAAPADTEGSAADADVSVDYLAREHLIRRLQTILVAENRHHHTPNTLGTVDDCLAALHTACNALANRSTTHQRPLDAAEWADLDHFLGYTLLLIDAHDQPRPAHFPPPRDIPPPGGAPEPGTAADHTTTEESDESP